MEESGYLDRKFWSDFLNINDYFKNTCVMKNCFDAEDQRKLYDGVTETLYRRIDDSILSDGIRVWDEGKQMKDDDLKKFFKENPVKENEDMIAYCERVFPTTFGIIMNNNECFSELLATRVSEMVDPLCELVGVPPLGYEITVFIGNYGWTPLGIHKDHVGENVIHFHLGPGRKQMYIWDDETYEGLVGKDVYNNENIEPILDKAKEFDFGTGDMFYMPWFENHVGYTKEISIGVTLWFRSSDNSKYSKRILEGFTSQFLPKDSRMIPPQINYLENNDSFENFRSTVSSYMDYPDPTLDDFLKSIYLDYKNCLMSNGGWSRVPLENKVDELDFDFLRNKKISIVEPFKIIYKNFENKKLYVFVRGNRIRTKYFEELLTFLSRLNNNETIDVNSLIKDKEVPEDPYLYFIFVLYQHKGIAISE